MSQVERGLIAYTVLQSSLQHGDLYDGLMLFIGPAIPAGRGLFVPADLSRRIADLYCMRVPPLVLESLAERMCKAGILTKRGEANGVVSYDYGTITSPLSSVTVPRIRALLDEFIAFARDRHESLRNEMNDDLENALLDRLLHVESLAILSRRDGTEVPKQTASTLGLPRRTQERADDKVPQHLDYLASRFLLEQLETDREGFDVLADVAAANLAAETLLSYREPPSKGDTFAELEVFLDAPLCMDMLGVNPGREEYGKQLAEELRRADVKVSVFLHSVAEVERVLDARRQSYLNGRGPYQHFQVDPPLTRELVAVTLGHVEEILTDQFGISIVDSSSSIPASRRSAVGAAEEHSIRERLLGWKNDDAREADVSTCCDLIRLRSALTVQRRILKGGVVLVTRNDTLAKAANGTWRNWLTETKRASVDRARAAAPIAISDKHLLGIIWITQGGRIGEISRVHLIANCAAAVATKRDVITRVYNTLIGVSDQSAQIFAAVINDQRAERAVMDATLGDPALVTDESVIPLLDAVRRATAEEVAAEKNKEIDALNTEVRKARLDSVRERAQLTHERDEAEQKQKAAEHRLSALAQRERERDCQRLRWAFRAARAAYLFCALIIVFGVTATFVFVQPVMVTWLNLRLGTELKGDSLIAPAIIGGIAAWALGWDVPDILFGSLRERVTTYTYRWVASKLSVALIIEEYDVDFKKGRFTERRKLAEN